MSFDGLLISKKVLSESINCVETNRDVFVEVLEVHISVSFELCLDEEFMIFW